MKKTFFYWVLLLGIAFHPHPVSDDDGWFDGCEKGEAQPLNGCLICPISAGKTELRSKVFITQGDEFEVVAVGEDNVIEELELDVQGRHLGY